MPNPPAELTGRRFGRLVALERVENLPGNANARWRCVCDCGTKKFILAPELKNGTTVSCGCWQADVHRKHNGACRGKKLKEYSVWRDMIGRCSNPNRKCYRDYGGRGITVCAEWRTDFARFLQDVGFRPGPEFSIDRINNNGNYEPGNVRWATRSQQNRNRRPFWFTKIARPVAAEGHL